MRDLTWPRRGPKFNLYHLREISMVFKMAVLTTKLGIDIAKSNNSKECIVYHYWYSNHGFKFQKCLCNGCHVLLMMCLNINDITIITVKGIDERRITQDISKYDAIHLLENSVPDDCGYI